MSRCVAKAELPHCIVPPRQSTAQHIGGEETARTDGYVDEGGGDLNAGRGRAGYKIAEAKLAETVCAEGVQGTVSFAVI